MLLPILFYPDKRLRTKAVPIKQVDDSIRTLVKNMFETMYDAPGIGLAATQVNHHIRLIVIDVSEDQSSPLCLINPEIIEKDGDLEWDEGCLSVPNYYECVTRANHIKVKALNEQGETFELAASDLLGVCIQHEIDHLDGILFVDYLSKLKQKRLLEKTKKAKQ
ncbi:peptide deformylase [Candidatus Thioglobus sp.]|uniref:peptide deformylase n=1 Tax=Candidatus Thioglobus sp. TaxID=2026721 RepID=UPI003D14DAF8